MWRHVASGSATCVTMWQCFGGNTATPTGEANGSMYIPYALNSSPVNVPWTAGTARHDELPSVHAAPAQGRRHDSRSRSSRYAAAQDGTASASRARIRMLHFRVSMRGYTLLQTSISPRGGEGKGREGGALCECGVSAKQTCAHSKPRTTAQHRVLPCTGVACIAKLPPWRATHRGTYHDQAQHTAQKRHGGSTTK